MRIRHRKDHLRTVDVLEQHTPQWYIGHDGRTYPTMDWELQPPPGRWEDVTRELIVEAMQAPAEGRHNLCHRNKRIGYFQFKGKYRMAVEDGRVVIQHQPEED